MPTFPLPQGGLAFGQTFATSTYGSTITAHASNANQQGTPVELIASTDQDAHWIEVMAGNPSANGAAYAVDILIGSSTEAILVPKLTFWARNPNEGGGRWLFPVFVPKGSRIAASVQSNSTTGPPTCLVGVILFNSGIAAHGMPMDVVQYGTLTNSLGVNIDAGTGANTKAGLQQITAATDRDHHWLTLTVAHSDTTWTGVTKHLVDIMIGASTEAVLVGNMPFGGAGNVDRITGIELVYHLPVYVPKGSRLAVRAQCSSTTDGDRDLFVVLHGA